MGLEGNIPRLRAERTLERAKLGEVRLTPDGWYTFCLAAGYTEEEAQETASAHALAMLRAKEPLE